MLPQPFHPAASNNPPLHLHPLIGSVLGRNTTGTSKTELLVNDQLPTERVDGGANSDAVHEHISKVRIIPTENA